jgi:hypothetical protein
MLTEKFVEGLAQVLATLIRLQDFEIGILLHLRPCIVGLVVVEDFTFCLHEVEVNEMSAKLTKYSRPPLDWVGAGPQTSECVSPPISLPFCPLIHVGWAFMWPSKWMVNPALMVQINEMRVKLMDGAYRTSQSIIQVFEYVRWYFIQYTMLVTKTNQRSR